MRNKTPTTKVGILRFRLRFRCKNTGSPHVHGLLSWASNKANCGGSSAFAVAFADGDWSDHRQAPQAPLAAATRTRWPDHVKQSQFRCQGTWECGLRIEGGSARWRVCNDEHGPVCETKPICPGGRMVGTDHPTRGGRGVKQSQFGRGGGPGACYSFELRAGGSYNPRFAKNSVHEGVLWQRKRKWSWRTAGGWIRA